MTTALDIADRQAAEQRTADHFVSAGLMDARQRDEVTLAAEKAERAFALTAAALGIVDEQLAVQHWSEAIGIPMLDGPIPIAAHMVAPTLKPDFLMNAQVVPLEDDGETVTLALADPYDAFSLRAIAQATSRNVRAVLAPPIEIEKALSRRLSDAVPAESGEGDIERLRGLASAAPAVRYLDQLLGDAAQRGATDIHVEPVSTGVRVRIRVDGMLTPVAPPARSLAAAVVSRIKILSGLDVAERRLPQDGRVTVPVGGRVIDFRVSTIPMVGGESVVLRLLDQGARPLTFESLGLSQHFVNRFRPLLARPYGMILVTGPTGSGKTTMLYTALRSIASEHVKIVTVEDPVEYQLDGIAQIQVDSKTDMSFARSLRAVLRHDPDVILVGEIRDRETAAIAIQAALTGHLVLATLHANSAATAITRLRDIGIENFMLSAVLVGVVAQRLIRQLCPDCAELQELDALSGERPVKRAARPRGCTACNMSGYRGRRAIAELLIPDERVTSLILQGKDHLDIEAAARAAGMQRLADAAFELVEAGETSLEEAARVTMAGLDGSEGAHAKL